MHSICRSSYLPAVFRAQGASVKDFSEGARAELHLNVQHLHSWRWLSVRSVAVPPCMCTQLHLEHASKLRPLLYTE